MDAFEDVLGDLQARQRPKGGDPAPFRANNPGALMPGGKLASFGTPEEGLKALDDNLSSYGKQGISTLAGVIGKWAPPNENDTGAYVADASKRLGIAPDQKIDLSNPYVRHAISTAIIVHENGRAVPAAQASEGDDPFGDVISDLQQRATRPAAKGVSTPRQSANQTMDKLAPPSIYGIAKSVAGDVVGGYRGLATLFGGGGVDEAARAVRQTQEATANNPEPGTTAAGVMGAVRSKANPMTWPGVAGEFLGDKVIDATASSGNPIIRAVGPALATIANTGTQFAAPVLVARGLSATKGLPARPAEPAPVAPAAANEPIAAPEPYQSPITVPAGEKVPVGAETVPTVPAGNATAAKPVVVSDPVAGVYAEPVMDTPAGVSSAEMTRRAQVLQEIGLDKVRRSAVTGDLKAASTDVQTAKLDTPAGKLMADTLAGEKQAVADYAENITRGTGGSALNDQSAKYARGGAIIEPLEALKDWFDTQTSALYKVADARAQGVPVSLDNFKGVLADTSNLTNSDRVHLQSAIGSYLKKLGVAAEDGNVSGTAVQAETIRKYLNENWSPQNSRFVGSLKDALDEDVTKAAGEDVYQEARRMRALRGRTIDDPNGIAKLLDSSGPNGVNRAVATEKIADTVSSMPVAQLKHVVDTLNNVPDEIKPQAQQALAEIKAQFSHNVKDIGARQAGQWNAKGVRQYLANNSARMNLVFGPEEMQKFGTLNDAGNILAKDQSYPGAFVQQHNLVRAGVSHALSKGGTALGAALDPTGGVVGALGGNMLGNKLAGRFEDAADLRATQKRMVELRDLLKSPD